MPTRSESIKAFLKINTHPDLADLYNKNMECQVNVAPDGGEKIKGEFKGRMWHGWTNGAQTWKPIRIPRNANTVPEDNDVPMTFDIMHAEAIGMTGWDWFNRCSRWVGFDFDEISSHKEQHNKKLDNTELQKVQDTATQLSWVTVRKSSGGKGLHLYVFFDPPIPTQNHTEHAALGRAILGKMSAVTGYDFNTKVDICGQNMWVYHRKMVGVDGLALIKKGEPLAEVPTNWRDHIKVITGHRQKTLPKFLKTELSSDDSNITETERYFLELASQVTRTALDEDHKKLISWLENNKTQSWWDADHHMLVTHTYYLKKAHEQLNLKGIFQTIASGSEAESGDHNCFCFPRKNGSWVVRRYSRGVQEHESWDQDGSGWTRCFYNSPSDLGAVARSNSGLESPSGGFVFKEAEMAEETARQLGATVPDLPPGVRSLKATLKPHKDGRLIFEIEGDNSGIAAHEMKGWLHNKGKWQRLFSTQINTSYESVEVGNYDEVIRHVVSGSGEDSGWMIRRGEEWSIEPLAHVRAMLQSMNLNQKEVNNVIGNSVVKAWKLVNKPFQPEYPGDREWNRGAAQLKFIPSQDTENLNYPHWKMILEHIGKGLNNEIQQHPWAKANNIETGADYLKIWIASMFKEPLQPLPYLFLYSEEQNTGKSIFHEAISLLLTKGYSFADVALTEQRGFNAELKNAILCVIEEVDLGKSKEALARIKNWVTAREFPVHEKGQTPYHIPNSTHWVQCANNMGFCPTFPGDTRITMIEVEPLDPMEMIPKRDMINFLEKEAPDFLASILQLEIPPSNDRLNVPVISTVQKHEAQQYNQTALQRFLSERCFFVAGEMITLAEFWDAFSEFMDHREQENWTKNKVSKELPSKFPRGRSPKDGRHYIGNISFTPKDSTLPPLVPKLQDKGYVFLVPNDNHKANPR